jgi:hypothetical protein
VEIERKWILKTLPEESNDCVLIGHYSVDQFYVDTEPVEVRLKRTITLFGAHQPLYAITIKSSNDGLTRSEIETDVPPYFYENTKLFINKAPIMKDYYIFKCNDNNIEVSVVENRFIYAEVEFKTEEEAQAYELPIDEAVEVTYEEDSKWKMANYWNATRSCDCGCQNLDYSYPVKEITASGENGIPGGDFGDTTEEVEISGSGEDGTSEGDLNKEETPDINASVEDGIAGGDFGN